MREKPIVKGRDARKFLLNSKINSNRRDLRELQIKVQPLNIAIYNLECELFELENELKEIEAGETE